ncbi:hypothetical protein BJF78_11555 [Pseudonocardia sp. CNS-139]|nr:hypothetical protein BJF78_11555 [Pseudonocardia sp. CNS-139]
MATAGAAAALAGLLFVAVSINLRAILASPRVPGRAGQALVMLTAPILLALVVLVPGQPATALGVELVAAAAVVGPVLGRLGWPGRRPPEQPVVAWLLVTALPSAGLTVGALLAGAGMLAGAFGGLYWLAGAVVLGLVGGLGNAWVLLIEILR